MIKKRRIRNTKPTKTALRREPLPDTALPIPGHDGYFANPDGTIWSIRRGNTIRRADLALQLKPRLFKTPGRTSGYLKVGIINDVGKVKIVSVHLLVLRTFKGEAPLNKPEA